MNHLRSLLKLQLKDVPSFYVEKALPELLPDTISDQVMDKLIADHYSLCGQLVSICAIMEFLVYFYNNQFDAVTPPGDLAGPREAHPKKEVTL